MAILMLEFVREAFFSGGFFSSLDKIIACNTNDSWICSVLLAHLGLR